MSLDADNNTKTQNPTRVIGIFSDYLQGLDRLRNELTKKEDNLKDILQTFYKLDANDSSHEKYQMYLQSVSESFDECHKLTTNNTVNRQIIIDGQVPIAKLINQLKKSPINLNESTIKIIIDFWENITYTLERFQILLDSLEKDIHHKLSVMSSGNLMTEIVEEITSSDDKVKVSVSDLGRYSRILPEKMLNCRFLIRSCGTHIQTQLLDRSLASDLLLRNVAIQRYPILRVIPDLEFKFTEICGICGKWLRKEETFILNINQQIRHRRLLVKEKETRIMSAQEHQKNIIVSLKKSFTLCQNSKIKMKEITKELKTLEAQIHATTSYQQQVAEEKYKTESMAEFLNISITQIRKNYSLQMKKQRLEIQIKELETTLIQLDSEISLFKQEMVIKSQERNKTKDTLKVGEKSYNDAKREIESYSQSLSNYKTELLSIKQSLKAMEGLQLLKSSPEYIDNVFGQPETSRSQSVQLAPSLQNAINRRTRKINSSM